MNIKTNGLRTLAAIYILTGVAAVPVLAGEASAPSSTFVTDGYDKLISDGSDKCVTTGSAPENLPARSCAETTPVAEPKKEAKEPMA